MPATNDRVRETSTTTGTGALTLAGAATGFVTFASAFSTADEVYYAVSGGAEWEVGVGSVSGSTLTRGRVLASSNAGALVNFSAGTKDVFATFPATAAAQVAASAGPNAWALYQGLYTGVL